MKGLAIFFCLTSALVARSQKIDSIFFHLYTDSLKKGTNNYINVDGKSSDGRWIPLTSAQLIFTTTGGKFENNDLVLPLDFPMEKVVVTARLKADTAIVKERTIFIKTRPDDEPLRSVEDVMGKPSGRKRKQLTGHKKTLQSATAGF